MSGIKIIMKSIDVAFSIYSKIPMPKFTWDSSDMKYHLCFFPWIGAVIGGLEWLWFKLAEWLSMGQICFVLFGVSIPLLVTGGFHMDGFMDTMDAIYSYQNRERKLEILKDPHIGAFSVICLAIYGLLFTGFFSEIKRPEYFGVFCCSFFLSRIFSGLSVICLKDAKKDGMLKTASNTAGRKAVFTTLLIQMVLCVVLMLYLSWLAGLISFVTACLSFLYYWRISSKQFGGITGDLAGFFVTVSELGMVMVIGIISVLFKG